MQLYQTQNFLGGQVTNQRVITQQAMGNAIAGINILNASDNETGQQLSLELIKARPQTLKTFLYQCNITASPGFTSGKCGLTIDGVLIESGNDHLTDFNLLMNELVSLINAHPTLSSVVTAHAATFSGLDGNQNGANGSSGQFEITANTDIDITDATVFSDANDWESSIQVTQELAPAIPNDQIRWNGGAWTDITGDGVYTLQAVADSTLEIDIDTSQLPAVATTESYTIQTPNENTFLNLSGIQVLEGNTDHICFFIKNDEATQKRVMLFIANQPTGDATLQLGFDPAGIGDGVNTGVATVIASDTDIPAGVVFSNPTTQAEALSVDLPAGQCIAAWLQRTITAGERPAKVATGKLDISTI